MKFSKHDLLALGTILLLIIIIFRKFFFQGLLPIPYNILVGWYFPFYLGGWDGYTPGIFFKGGLYAADVFRQMIPWKMLAVEQIKSGQLPLWNPFNFSGEPLLANIQATVFYPLSFLFFLTDFNSAWSLYIILSPLLGALFMFLFLRSIKLTTFPCLVGSLAFAFSGHMVSWLEWGVVTHSGIWLPLILLSINQVIRHNKLWAKLTLIFAASATILGGYPQESAYALILSTIYFFWLSRSQGDLKQYVKQVLLPIAVIITLISFQLLPTLNLFDQSALKGAASQDLFLRTRLSPQHALTLFAPDYFGNRITGNYWANTFTKVDYTDANLFIGSVALVFALYSLLISKKSSHHKLFLAIAVITFILALKSPLTRVLAALQIPTISTGVASGVLYLTAFSLAAMAGIGAQGWINKPSSKNLIKVLPIYALTLATLLLVPSEFRRVSARNLVIPLSTALGAIVILIASAHPVLNRPVKQLHNKLNPKIVAIIFLVILSSVEYTIYAGKILSFSPRKFAYPRHQLIHQLQQISGLDRSMGFWDSEIANNLHTQYKVYGVEGYNPLHPLAYQELTASGETGQLPDTLFRSDADVAVKNETNRNRFLDLSSVKYIAAKVTDPKEEWEQEPLKYDPTRFKLIWQQGAFKIYQNLSALPRVQLFNQYQVIADKHERIKTLYSPDWDPHSSLILDSEPQSSISQEATGSAQITSYTPNQVIINTNTTQGNSLLLLTDTYYPSWQASINDQPTQILPANHTFRAITVPEGEHKIEFKIAWP